MNDKLRAWLKTVPFDGPTEWGLDALVLGREAITTWGRFRQALREVSMREGAQASPKRDRELDHFARRAVEAGEELVAEHGALDPGVCSKLDREHHEARARLMVALDVLCVGRVTHGTAELLLTLSPEARARMLEIPALNHAELKGVIVSAGVVQ